ncbi:MAG: prolipoprotein diacylglyceryl transferase [Pseudomonadota bacterium]
MTLVLPFPVFDPVAVEVGPIAIRWYALAYIAGIVLGWLLARRLVARPALWHGREAPALKDVDDLVTWATLGVVIGGRLGSVLIYNFDYYLANPLEALMVWQGGMAFHGGLLGVVVATLLFCRVKRLPPLAFFDVMAVIVPIGLFFGRIANFVNAELWGRVSDVPWAMVFPGAGPEPRHPSQLYQAALEGLVLFAVMLIAVRLGALKRPGLCLGLFASGYGLARIAGEVFREPDAQLGFLFGPVTMGMLLSVPMVLIGLGFVLSARR